MMVWLRLTRARLVATAWSNTLLGAALAAHIRGERVQPREFSAALISATALYLMGMALNDYMDRGRDRTVHPDRPLPSGLITLRAARVLLLLLLISSILASAFAGWSTLVATLGVTLLIVSYDCVTKQLGIIGAVSMGLVRFALVLIGATTATGHAFGAKDVCLAAGVVGLYVALLTHFSQEEERSDRKILVRRCGRILGFACAAILVSFASARVLSAIAFIGLLMWTWHAIAPLRSEPPAPQRATLRLLLGLFILDAALLLFYDQIWPAVVCLSLGAITTLPFYFPVWSRRK
ncbi:MAG: UbiA family prenyltransferase [Planctomycetota bacterium]